MIEAELHDFKEKKAKQGKEPVDLADRVNKANMVYITSYRIHVVVGAPILESRNDGKTYATNATNATRAYSNSGYGCFSFNSTHTWVPRNSSMPLLHLCVFPSCGDAAVLMYFDDL